jgi:hypothetical protein
LRKGEIDAAADDLDRDLVRLYKRWLKSDDGSAIQVMLINLGAVR